MYIGSSLKALTYRLSIMINGKNCIMLSVQCIPSPNNPTYPCEFCVTNYSRGLATVALPCAASSASARSTSVMASLALGLGKVERP